MVKFSNFHRISGLGDTGALHLAVCYGYIGAEDTKKCIFIGFTQGESIQVQYNIFADLDGVCAFKRQRTPQRDYAPVLSGIQCFFQTGVSFAVDFKCLHQRFAEGAVTGAVHLARMVAVSAADTFAVLILAGMLDHLDHFILDAYFGNIHNSAIFGVCKSISVRQQSQSLRTSFYIDSTLERAALQLGFPGAHHLTPKHAVALYRQGILVRKDHLVCCNAV